MTKSFIIFAVLVAVAAPVFSEPCVVLDYQEMKDLSVNDLVIEACKSNRTDASNFRASMTYPSMSPAANEADRDHDQCKGQVDRMLRVIRAKGVNGKLYELCEQQARGEVIAASRSDQKTATPASP